MQKEETTMNREYRNRIHRMGRILTVVSIVSMFAPVIGILAVYGIRLDWSATVGGMMKVLAIFGLIGMTEFFSFTPILGPGASYLGFITGNITTMKLPCATNALKLVNAKAGTEKADVVSILAVGTSSIVSTVICAMGMVLISAIHPILSSEVLKPGFDNMVPALIGAMSAPYFVRSPRTTSVPMILMVIVTGIFGASFILEYDSLFSIIFMVITVIWSYLLYRKTNY